jgi:hypothetical protein
MASAPRDENAPAPPEIAPARRSRPTLGLLMLAVVAVAIPASVAGTLLRDSSSTGAVWLLGLWGVGIVLVAIAIGAWWRHTTAQVLLQVIVVSGLFSAVFPLAAVIPNEDLVPHGAALLSFAVTVVIPLVLRRRALERHPPGPSRDRLLRLAAVGFAAGLNGVAQFVYIQVYYLNFH